MSDSEPRTRIPHRPWWPVWMMGTATALLVAVAMFFAVVTSIQARQRAEQIDRNEAARIECRARYNAQITAREQVADNAEHGLLTLIVRTIVLPREERSSDDLLKSADRIDTYNQLTSEVIDELLDYTEAGSPLPCPLTNGE